MSLQWKRTLQDRVVLKTIHRINDFLAPTERIQFTLLEFWDKIHQSLTGMTQREVQILYLYAYYLITELSHERPIVRMVQEMGGKWQRILKRGPAQPVDLEIDPFSFYGKKSYQDFIDWYRTLDKRYFLEHQDQYKKEVDDVLADLKERRETKKKNEKKKKKKRVRFAEGPQPVRFIEVERMSIKTAERTQKRTKRYEFFREGDVLRRFSDDDLEKEIVRRKKRTPEEKRKESLRKKRRRKRHVKFRKKREGKLAKDTDFRRNRMKILMIYADHVLEYENETDKGSSVYDVDVLTSEENLNLFLTEEFEDEELFIRKFLAFLATKRTHFDPTNYEMMQEFLSEYQQDRIRKRIIREKKKIDKRIQLLQILDRYSEVVIQTYVVEEEGGYDTELLQKRLPELDFSEEEKVFLVTYLEFRSPKHFRPFHKSFQRFTKRWQRGDYEREEQERPQRIHEGPSLEEQFISQREAFEKELRKQDEMLEIRTSVDLDILQEIELLIDKDLERVQFKYGTAEQKNILLDYQRWIERTKPNQLRWKPSELILLFLDYPNQQDILFLSRFSDYLMTTLGNNGKYTLFDYKIMNGFLKDLKEPAQTIMEPSFDTEEEEDEDLGYWDRELKERNKKLKQVFAEETFSEQLDRLYEQSIIDVTLDLYDPNVLLNLEKLGQN